jgi:copper chaperone
MATHNHLKEGTMTEVTLKIEGMSCQHCVMRVKKAVSQLAGVSDSQVDVGSAKVTYDESKVARADLDKAVMAAGYKVVE